MLSESKLRIPMISVTLILIIFPLANKFNLLLFLHNYCINLMKIYEKVD